MFYATAPLTNAQLDRRKLIEGSVALGLAGLGGLYRFSTLGSQSARAQADLLFEDHIVTAFAHARDRI